MKNNVRRILCLAILASVVSSVTACKSSSSTSKTETATTNTSGFKYDGKGPITDKQETLSILATNAWTSSVDLNKAEIVKKIGEKAGVTINWELLAPSTYNDAIAPRLAAGTNLPDIVYLLDNDSNLKYVKGGIFKAIDNYYAKDGVNLKKLYEGEYSSVKASLTASDGKMYYVPQMTATTDYSPCFMVNVRWLEKLGLKEPTTLQEYTDMLRKFKTGDPNGNGKQDEIPLSLDAGIISSAFGPMFGLDLANKFYADNSGKVHYGYYEAAYKDYLTYLNGLYKEGLLEMDYASTKRDKTTSRFSQDISGTTFDYSYSQSMIYSPVYKDYDKKTPIIKGIMPLKGDKGEGGYYTGRLPMTGSFGITKDSKNPELAFRFLDFAIGEDAQQLYTWGVEGVTYTVVDGKKQLTDKGKDNAFVQPFGINPVNLPIIQGVASVDQMVAPWHLEFNQKVKAVTKMPSFPFVYSLPEEASIDSQYMTDIDTYVTEMNNKFITGLESLSNYDNFTKKLKSMGIEEVLKAKQAQYDRYAAATKKK
jgi:putative aldouronate transport system substrate-binding protein